MVSVEACACHSQCVFPKYGWFQCSALRRTRRLYQNPGNDFIQREMERMWQRDGAGKRKETGSGEEKWDWEIPPNGEYPSKTFFCQDDVGSFVFFVKLSFVFLPKRRRLFYCLATKYILCKLYLLCWMVIFGLNQYLVRLSLQDGYENSKSIKIYFWIPFLPHTVSKQTKPQIFRDS